MIVRSCMFCGKLGAPGPFRHQVRRGDGSLSKLHHAWHHDYCFNAQIERQVAAGKRP